MTKVQLSLDTVKYNQKPNSEQMRGINNRVARGGIEGDIEEMACKIAKEGHSFCTATFDGGKRRKANYKSQQLFALDFDDGTSYETIKKLSEEYLLPICFSYYTFSSTKEHERFRVVFLLDCIVDNLELAETFLHMLRTIFPGSDTHCSDVTHLYLGSKSGLIDFSEKSVELIDLCIAFASARKKMDPSHFKRDMERFAKRRGISIDSKNCIGIIKNPKMGEVSTSEYYILGVVKKSPKYAIRRYEEKSYIREKDKSLKKYTQKGRVTELKYGARYCKLFAYFLEGVDIGHFGRLLIMLSLQQVRGGKKLFLETLKRTGGDYPKWKDAIKYVTAYEHEIGCERCEYCDKCDHSITMLSTVREKYKEFRPDKEVTLLAEQSYVPLEKARLHLKSSVERALNLPQSLVLIKAQTGLGKTHTYCQIVSETERKFIIALPNNDMKREVAGVLQRGGINPKDMVVTPSHRENGFPEDLKIIIEEKLSKGLYLTNKLIKKYLKENEGKLDFNVQCLLNEFLDFKDRINAGTRVVVTTHTRLATFDDAMVKDYIVIVDEDILVSSFFMHTREISVEALKKAADELPDDGFFSEIVNGKEGEVITIPPHFIRFFTEEELSDAEIFENVNELMRAVTYIKENGVVKYYYPGRLPKTKCIVLSATLDEEIYKRYFRLHEREIVFFESAHAKYKGKLIQFVAHTLGRNTLRHEGNWPKIRETLSSYLKDYQIITFKEFQDTVVGVTPGTYFSKCIGTNRYKGKNLAIVGTPFGQDESYRLIAGYLGEIDGSDKMRLIRTVYKDKEFWHYTYDNEVLKRLQCYWISGELEQAIGRSRLLMYDCTVVVFASVPAEQAEYHTTDYLRNTENED